MDYRHSNPLDAGAQRLPDILARPIEALAEERLKTYMLPRFWLDHAKRHRVNERTRRPGSTGPVLAILRTGVPLFLACCDNHPYETFWINWLGLEAVLAVFVGLTALTALVCARLAPSERTTGMGLARVGMMYFFPFIGLWYGGKEALAAVIRRYRLKTPLTYDQARAQILAEGRTATVDALKRRLKLATDDHGEDGTSPIARAAEAAILGYERSLDDYAKLCGAPSGDRNWVRERLSFDYLRALQAVESAERGPSFVTVTAAVGAAPPLREPDMSDLAFADTAVQHRDRLGRTP